MGNSCSKESHDETSKDDTPIHPTKIGLNFSHEEWKNFHDHGSIEQNQKELQDIGIDLKKNEQFPKCLTRAAFICCNNYTTPKYSLRMGPINDAVTVAKFMKEIGFHVYYLINPRSSEYTKHFKNFIQKTAEYLVIYYTGHGASVNELDENNNDVKGEALIFDDSYLFSDKLIDLIIHSGKPPTCKLCLLSDCCHSNSVYDFQTSKKKIPPNVLSLTSVRVPDAPKPTSVGGTDQGILTFYFFRLLSQKNSMNPRDIEEQIDQYLKRFQQNFVIYTTTDSMLSEPIFKI